MMSFSKVLVLGPLLLGSSAVALQGDRIGGSSSGPVDLKMKHLNYISLPFFIVARAMIESGCV